MFHSGVVGARLAVVACVFFASGISAQEKQLLWGDTHLHTSYSSDAFANNNLTATPDTAYRFAKGAPVLHPYNGMRVQLETPLDFLVVSDHAEFMGVIRNIYFNGTDPENIGFVDQLKAWVAAQILRRNVDKQTARELFVDVLPEPYDDIVEAARTWEPSIGWIPSQPNVEVNTWNTITDAAETHNDPGRFTALIGWEYSSIPGGANLHRVVVTDLDASTAQTFVPFGLDNSVYPEDLWAWLEATQAETGGSYLAIPHNSNISKGAMFDVTTLRGEPIGAEYAATRQYWEPIAEITQIKGDSETHPSLSPDDPFADFETYPYYIQRTLSEYKPAEGDYVRSALKRGLALEAATGVNPYQFGVIGSTDAHTALASAEENNFHGKMATDSIPENKLVKWSDDRADGPFGWGMSAQGLAAVWAEDNSRQSIVAAMRRREVYATTGPRIGVRFYAGWELSPEDLADATFPDNLNERGVPMGGELTGGPYAGSTSPTLLIEATADPLSGTLDRVQVVKGWIDDNGATHEQVFNVAWAGEDRAGVDGALTPIASTVDLTNGRWDNSVGAARLTAAWQDPEFNPQLAAFYYVRVLQIPTPRHSLYDKLALEGSLNTLTDQAGEVVDTRRPDVIQERAYTSSIWYSP